MFRPLALLLFLLAASCSKKYAAFTPQYEVSNKNTRPDYADLYYWAAHPQKWDPSDSLPAALKEQARDSLADVFFIYPTTYTGAREEWNADINDAALNAKTDYTSILYQASAFNQHARVFSPRYRQGHLSAFFIPLEENKSIFDTAYADVKTAFEFYLQHYNAHRPMIIAGHSQGAMLAERLLKEFFDGRPLQKQLVAAYIIGWPIAPDLFESIPVCSDPVQTGCFCGWRTLKKKFVPGYIRKESTVSLVTNPLTWTTSGEYAGREKNDGSVLQNFSKIVLHTTDAQVHEGVLWSKRPKFPGSIFFRTRNYHIADINLFYMNLRKNIETRINAYLRKP